ncbi:MAG: M20/M25/M40 family metallo-hydrolase [Clostridiales bacterium]|nr:M20/M25/M40 family metallo-hydrolase [Clostridiales bacterium]MDD7431848.1 M20/M25/M40 family metallo-hydrolase [Clostridiales bacterium]MDY3062054.1 M20/M25/M40 family metallo-hydrolase [Eubacteriales bacterium]
MNFDFLKEMVETESVSGGEIKLQKKVRDYMQSKDVAVRTDYSGNVISSLNPESPFQILMAGHIDEIGFRVTHITKEGYLKVNKAGYIRPELMQGKRVTVLGKKRLTGVFGLLLKEGTVRKDTELYEMYVDCGFTDQKEAAAQVEIGDFVTYTYTLDQLENRRIAGRALDDKLGAFSVLQALLRARELGCRVGLNAVTTVGEETTMRGAYFAASGLKPDLAIAVDVIHSSDYSGSEEASFGDIKLGSGPVLVRTSSSNEKIYQALKATAEKLDIKVQTEVAGGNSGTDSDKMTQCLAGIPTAVLSIPLRYMHSPSEVGSLQDVEETIELLAQFAAGLSENFNLDPFTEY